MPGSFEVGHDVCTLAGGNVLARSDVPLHVGASPRECFHSVERFSTRQPAIVKEGGGSSIEKSRMLPSRRFHCSQPSMKPAAPPVLLKRARAS